MIDNYELVGHVRGESKFLDDIPELSDTHYTYVFTSPVAHGKIKNIDIQNALESDGVVDVFTSKDIKGENQIGGIIQDEPLLADKEVHFIGQPIAVVVAKSNYLAKQAAKKIIIDIEEFPVVTEPRIAYQKNHLIMPPKIFESGDVYNAWKECDFIIEGKADSGGQEHVYLETQASYSFLKENGGIKIISSTQSPTAVQRVASRVLGIPMNKVEVEVLRLGGGFGGKEDQATSWAVISAMAAYLIGKPVKIILSRHDDILWTGKRHPYSSDFKIGLNKEGKIIAFEVTYYQNAGAAADLSPAILERTLFHATNSYFIPNVRATAYSCKTNLPPNTAFRGFGGPQAMFVIESAIHKASEIIGIPTSEIQEINLIKENDRFYYGQKVINSNATKCFIRAKEKYNYDKMLDDVCNFNKHNKFVKKGIAVIPICFGISFTSTFLNQASSLVHIYTDGSIVISTAAVEMGQGVNMKIRQVASRVFSVDISRIRIETTNTSRNANTSPTAASSAADLNGKATLIACNNILVRLKELASKELKCEKGEIEFSDEVILRNGIKTELNWLNLIQIAYKERISLSSLAHYATPEIYFDRNTNKGHPFAYYSFGTAIIQSKVDCLRGTYKIESVKVVHDFGKSINKVIDRGQAEGAIMQGIGWMTIEDVVYSEKGKNLSDTLSTYKVPDVMFTPEDFEIEFMENPSDSLAVFNSKAIGEPPFMYGIAAFFSILNAMKAFNPDIQVEYKAPLTPERVLLQLYKKN
jgi:xanthine dehydrogenase large subunit